MKYFDHLVKLSEALQLEKKHETELFENAVKNKSVYERKQSGKCLYPLQVKETNFGIAGFLEVVLEADHQTDVTHFSVGSIVSVFNSKDNIKSNALVTATVKWAKKNLIGIQFKQDDEPDELHELPLGLDLTVDDRTYKVLEHTLNLFINTEEHELKSKFKKMWGDAPVDAADVSHEINVSQLNEWQNKALNLTLNMPDFSVIHGPPGTGKTTTLVACIQQKIKTEKRVLVCANSNAAVDLLAKKLLQKGVNVVRIGNIARVDKEVQSTQLDIRIQSEQDYKLIKDLKKRAADARKKAEKFKRSFSQEDRQNRRAWYRESRDLIKEARDTEKYLLEKVIQGAEAVCCTLIGSDHELLRCIDFKTVFIDEAGQALIPAALTPLKRAQKLVLAGDPFQLPPLVKSSEAAKLGLDQSLLEVLMRNQPDRTGVLRIQYRMDQKIMEFSNTQFYEGQLQAHESVVNHGLVQDGLEPVEFIDTAGCGFDEGFNENKSLFNEGEAGIVQKRLAELQVLHEDKSVGIISPYRGHVNLLKDTLPELESQINTVDAFQGQERDIIIVSLVRSNEEGIIGFLKDYRRMNVAMTRARQKLILVGDSATIGNDSFYASFLEFVETKGTYRSAWEYA